MLKNTVIYCTIFILTISYVLVYRGEPNAVQNYIVGSALIAAAIGLDRGLHILKLVKELEPENYKKIMKELLIEKFSGGTLSDNETMQKISCDNSQHDAWMVANVVVFIVTSLYLLSQRRI